MTKFKYLVVLLYILNISFSSYAAKDDFRVRENSYGYLVSYLSKSIMYDFFRLSQRNIEMTIIHPNFGIQRVKGYAYLYDLHTLGLMTSERIRNLPDYVNSIILLDSVEKDEKLTHYRHVDNQLYWTFKGRNDNPDNLTGLPVGPQPYYCGTELCACAIGYDGPASCDGMALVAKGACRTNEGIKTCCQTAGTKPVDINGGRTTTCVNAGNS